MNKYLGTTGISSIFNIFKELNTKENKMEEMSDIDVLKMWNSTPKYGCAPAGEIDYYNYTVNEESKTVVLNTAINKIDEHQTGDVIIYNSYLINGEEYKTILPNTIQGDALVFANLFNVHSGYFKGNNIKSITFDKIDSLDTISQRFDCTIYGSDSALINLTHIDMRMINFENISGLYNFIVGCPNLETIDLRGCNNKMIRVNGSMTCCFFNCPKLKHVYVTEGLWETPVNSTGIFGGTTPINDYTYA